MRPPSPPLFAQRGHRRASSALDQPTRIILRQIARCPARSGVTGAASRWPSGLVVTSMQWMDAIDRMVDVYFFDGQVQDVTVGFGDAQSSRGDARASTACPA